MAIYSCNHKAIGRSTHKPFTAAAHINYITRPSVLTEMMASHMPADRHEAVDWIRQQELEDRKNARVIDKLMIALPEELTPEQRSALVRDFCGQLTQDRCPWYAAIHAEGKDAKNPHAHIVIRDRDINTGKRALNMSEKGSTEHVRQLWEQTCNTHLALHGHKVRIDRRTLGAQGIEREAQIHIGPNANEAAKRQYKLVSKIRKDEHGREIRYPDIDKGRTRRAFNENIIDINLERLKQSGDYATRLKAAYEIEQRKKDSALLERRDAIRRRYRQENGKLWHEYSGNRDKLKAAFRKEKDQALAEHKERYKPVWADHFKRKELALKELDYMEQVYKSKLGNLKEIMQSTWRDKDTSQDKNSKLLTHIFEHHTKKETRLKAIEKHFKTENRQIYKEYTEQKNFIQSDLKRSYDPFFRIAEREWKKKKDELRKKTGEQWQEYKQQAQERRYEKRLERDNLDSFVADYYNSLAEGKSGDISEDRKEDRIEKRMREMEERKQDRTRDRGRERGR